MNELVDYNKYKKYYKAAGAMCLLIAAVGFSIAVFIAVCFVELVNAPTIDSGVILFFIKGAITVFATIEYVAGILVFCALSVMFTMSGVTLITQTNVCRTKTAVSFSFVGSLSVLFVSIYPFVINVCRIAAHGYLQEYYFGFWFGFLAFVFSTLCLVFNRIAVREYKGALIKKSLLQGGDE